MFEFKDASLELGENRQLRMCASLNEGEEGEESQQWLLRYEADGAVVENKASRGIVLDIAFVGGLMQLVARPRVKARKEQRFTLIVVPEDDA
jgi:hypothetical protein